MRKELDNWSFSAEGETIQESLSRFLIAIDELRARLNPQKYPNLEISDEGYLWFNIPFPLGTFEILAFPYGFGHFPGPALAISFPHKPENLTKDFLETLCDLSSAFPDLSVFAAYAPLQQILKAYSENELPGLYTLKGKEEIHAISSQVEFFPYFGLYVLVENRNVSFIEKLIKEIMGYFKNTFK